MAGIVLDPVNSVEDIERNLKRLNEAIVAMQGGSIAMENIVGYENLATKDDLADEVKKLHDRHDYQIGDLYFSLDKENPKEKLGYGEWELVAQGKAITGVDTKFLPDGAIDPDYEEDEDFKAPETTGGAKDVTLQMDNLPASPVELESPWKYDTRGPYYKNNDGAISKTGYGNSTSSNVKTKNLGKGTAISVLQPYYCTYIWRRTA